MNYNLHDVNLRTTNVITFDNEDPICTHDKHSRV